MTVFFSNFSLDTGFLDEEEYIVIEESFTTPESVINREETPEEWVKKNLLNDETKKLKRGRCDPLTYLEETYGALPPTYECSLCGRNCQDEKKYNLHLLGKFLKNCLLYKFTNLEIAHTLWYEN